MIPDAAVEAAAKAQYERTNRRSWENMNPAYRENWLTDARVGLEAAAPYIAAEALTDAADAFEALPVRTPMGPGTWDWFELFPIEQLRDRAEAIRSAK